MQLKNLCLTLLLVFFSLSAFAGKEIVFRKQTQVYQDKDQNSAVIGVYEKGDAIPISTIKYGQWRKVIADVDGKKQVGWIYLKDIIGSHIKDSSEIAEAKQDKNADPVYHRHNGIGLFGSLSYVYQQAGTVTGTTTDVAASLSANYTSVKGSTFYYGVFGDFNLSQTLALRVTLAERSLERSGTASATVNGVGTNNGNTSFKIDQSTLALGATLKFYSSPQAIFWWGGGLEIDRVSKFQLVGTSALAYTANASSKPMYIMVTGSAGYDFNLSGKLFFLPTLQLGVIANGSPFITTFEVMLPVAYSF